ncbi:MAG TPA: plastocyanin/azurin family copper-binding protein [Caulobacteraceae bacterium]|jgi:plastocyanin
MKTSLALIALSALAVALPVSAQEARPAAVVIMNLGHSFTPAEITVPVGATVEWRNRAFFHHTATFDPAKAGDPAHVRLPAGVAPFDSSKIGGGKSWSHRFTTPGRYRYVCLPHEDHGMIGVVNVTGG